MRTMGISARRADLGQRIIGGIGGSRSVSSRWIALLILCTGFLMIVVDTTIVNVALPSIQRDLNFSQAGLAWVVNAYLIAYAGIMLLAGRLGDLIGRRRVFLIGLGIFTAASLLSGLSFSQPMLIAARFVQGVGGAVSSAVILAMIVTLFPEQGERARAMGIFAFVASAGGALGLLVGGLITQTMSWHWIFFINLPIGIATMMLGARLIESDRGIGLGEGADVLGAALVTAALMLGVYTIVESDVYGLGSLHTLGLGGLALALLAAFVVRQARTANPLMPLRLFRSRNLTGANLIQALMVAAFFAVFFLGSLDLQRVLHYGPLAIGLAFLPNTVAMAALSIGLSARLITRFGSRNVAVAGLIFIAVGLLLFVRSPMNADYLRDLFLPMVLIGIGAGLAFTSLSLLAMADTTPSDSGLASGVLNTTTQVGAALGLAVLATVSADRSAQLVAEGQHIVAALSGGYHFAWAIGAGLVIVAVVLAVVMLKSDTPAAETEAAPAVDSSAAEEAEESDSAAEELEVCA
ncbi:MAG TPA: MFS transporter [Ktedonobacterales bacterium]|nr:MFS transporter [Ktedonobacterales bacterium]